MEQQPTSEEIKRFKQLEKLMNPKYPKPTDADIERVVTKLEARLAEKAINRRCNFAVKEGYTKAVELLRARITDLTKSSIGDLETEQGRFIAWIAIDYMVGECSEDTLCGVPIKKM
jgi:hypothetical protein